MKNNADLNLLSEPQHQTEGCYNPQIIQYGIVIEKDFSSLGTQNWPHHTFRISSHKRKGTFI